MNNKKNASYMLYQKMVWCGVCWSVGLCRSYNMIMPVNELLALWKLADWDFGTLASASW